MKKKQEYFTNIPANQYICKNNLHLLAIRTGSSPGRFVGAWWCQYEIFGDSWFNGSDISSGIVVNHCHIAGIHDAITIYIGFSIS